MKRAASVMIRTKSKYELADSLKDSIRDGLVRLNMDERIDFIRRIQEGLKKVHINFSSILQISATYRQEIQDITPSDVGQVVRYFYINNNEAALGIIADVTKMYSSLANTMSTYSLRS